jgi:hypothetical protein
VQIGAQFGGIYNPPMGSAMSFVTVGLSLAVVVVMVSLLAQWRPR